MGKLQILPNLLDDTLEIDPFFPPALKEIVPTLDGLIAESEKAARKYLRRFISREALDHVELKVLNEHTKKEELNSFIEPILKGENWGLISDAGLACIADPGSELVALAHIHGIDLKTYPGPSSLVMALQLSGFSGQNFSFHGYLPRDLTDLEQKIISIEKKSNETTQIWIEAPYRSGKMLDLLKRVLNPSTYLCVASCLTSASQRVVSQSIKQWKESAFCLQKEPVVFLISRR